MIFNIFKIRNKFYYLRTSLKDAVFYLWDFRYVKIYALIFLIGNILLWYGAFSINSRVEGDLIVLHYNVDFGNDLIGSPDRLYIIPLLSLVIFFVNILLLINFSGTSHFRFAGHLLLSNTLFVNFFLLASLAGIFLVNFK